MTNINITFFIRAAGSTIESSYRVDRQHTPTFSINPVAIVGEDGGSDDLDSLPVPLVRVEIQEKKSEM